MSGTWVWWPTCPLQLWTYITCYKYIWCMVWLSLVSLIAGVCVCVWVCIWVWVHLVGWFTGTIRPGGVPCPVAGHTWGRCSHKPADDQTLSRELLSSVVEFSPMLDRFVRLPVSFPAASQWVWVCHSVVHLQLLLLFSQENCRMRGQQARVTRTLSRCKEHWHWMKKRHGSLGHTGIYWWITSPCK